MRLSDAITSLSGVCYESSRRLVGDVAAVVPSPDHSVAPQLVLGAAERAELAGAHQVAKDLRDAASCLSDFVRALSAQVCAG